MKTLQINVQNKVAQYDKAGGAIMCGNDDYQIEFLFDSEWDAHADAVKVALFFSAAGKEPVEFTGNVCPVPVMVKTSQVEVGVYVKGENCATTTTCIPCTPSVLCKTAPHRSGSAVVNGDSVFVRYSEHADGTDFTEEWRAGQKYIGQATGQSAPTDKSAYKWALFAAGGMECVGSVTLVPSIGQEAYYLGDDYSWNRTGGYANGSYALDAIARCDLIIVTLTMASDSYETFNLILSGGQGYRSYAENSMVSDGSEGAYIPSMLADLIFGEPSYTEEGWLECEVLAESVTFTGYNFPKE